jgi:hypothetical protein
MELGQFMPSESKYSLHLSDVRRKVTLHLMQNKKNKLLFDNDLHDRHGRCHRAVPYNHPQSEPPGMRMSALRLIGIVAASSLIASCGERSDLTGPAAVTGSTAQRSILGSPSTVNVVTRDTPLPASLSTSVVIGLFGGRLSLPGAGLSVVVPPLAVASPTRITVTAVAGNQVAYEFEPHGTHFLVPLVVTQSLVGTSALSGGLLPKPVSAAYFASLSDLDPLGGTALVSELLGTTVSLLTRTATFPVFHFSGYLIATGLTDGGDGSSQ